LILQFLDLGTPYRRKGRQLPLEEAGSHIINLSSTCSKMKKKINDISQSAYSVPGEDDDDDDDDDEWIDNSLSLVSWIENWQPSHEGNVCRIEIVRAPAKQERVQRLDIRNEARRLGTA
jgi:hypothetical protein